MSFAGLNKRILMFSSLMKVFCERVGFDYFVIPEYVSILNNYLAFLNNSSIELFFMI
jgi:hypothetical protein